MKKIQTISNILITSLLVVLIGCSEKNGDKNEQMNAVEQNNPVIVVSNYPLFYFTERLAPKAEIKFPAEGCGDPAYWKPGTDDITLMQKADLIILNGAGYEKWLATISVPSTKVVNSLKGMKDHLIKLDDKVTHSHGIEGEHEHGETAFTTWLDYKLAVKQAKVIKEALIQWTSLNGEEIEKNFNSLKADLLSVDAQMSVAAAKFKDKTLYASHPVYQYLSKAYNLNILSEHWEPDEFPGEEMWNSFKMKLKKFPSDIMLWEDTPLPETEKRLNELGLRIVVFNPCSKKPETGDFLSTMDSNIEGLLIQN